MGLQASAVRASKRVGRQPAPSALLLHHREPVALLALVVQEKEVELQPVDIDDGGTRLVERKIKCGVIERNGPAAGMTGTAGHHGDLAKVRRPPARLLISALAIRATI